MSKSPQIPVGFITMEQAISRVEPLIKAGLTDKEIADQVGLAEQTSSDSAATSRTADISREAAS